MGVCEIVQSAEAGRKEQEFYTEIGIDEVRAGASAAFHRGSGAGGWRSPSTVMAPNDLNRSSANALLKLIEEPPTRAVFVDRHQPGRLLPTIRSRCRRLMSSPGAAGHNASRVRAGRRIASSPTKR